jgi:flagellum-specific peptidoglycan hydrolase FlgJ
MDPATFLLKAFNAATQASHIWPAYAAAESALESAWGRSELAVKANNLFGQKQSHPPIGATLSLPTKEFLHGTWVTVQASWAVFADWEACFAARMALLRNLATDYPNYQLALEAPDGEAFITEVSKSWSTDPDRGAKVLSIYHAHSALFGAGQ